MYTVETITYYHRCIVDMRQKCNFSLIFVIRMFIDSTHVTGQWYSLRHVRIHAQASPCTDLIMGTLIFSAFRYWNVLSSLCMQFWILFVYEYVELKLVNWIYHLDYCARLSTGTSFINWNKLYGVIAMTETPPTDLNTFRVYRWCCCKWQVN